MITDDCQQCRDYADVRTLVLVPAMAERCEETGETPKQIADRFMLGVHARHLAGLPIMPGGAS
jgi:hypothetical protein